MKSRFTALLLAGVLGVSLLTGCGGINKNAVAATLKDQEISLGLVNFYVQFQRAGMEDMYRMYVGDDMWNQDMSGSGSTMGDSLKEGAMESLHAMYTLKAHMGDYNVELTDAEKSAITEAASSFMSSNSQEAIAELGASQEIVEELLTLLTIEDKVRDAVEAGADTNVSDEEANMRGYSQIEIRTDSYTDASGNTVEYTAAEKVDLRVLADQMVSELKEEGATLESVAQAHEYQVTKESYATYEADDDTDEDEESEEDGEPEEDEVVEMLKWLKPGENSGVVEKENAFYIVRLDSETDAEATEKNRQSIITERKNDFYNETLEEWQKDDGWTVNEGKLDKIEFENGFTTTDPNAAEGTP